MPPINTTKISATIKPTTLEYLLDPNDITTRKDAADYIVDAATLEIVKRYLLHNKTFIDRAELMAIIGISDPEKDSISND